MSNFPLIVSIPVHESLECAVDQAANWNRFAPSAAIVFHVSVDSDFSDNDLRERLPCVHPYAFVNYERHKTGWADGSLLRVHASNYAIAAKKGLKFERFAMDASNTLLVREGLEDHVMEHEAGYNMPVNALPDALARPMMEDEGLWNLHHKHSGKHDIGVVPCEGLWFDFEKMSAVFDTIASLSGAYVTEEVYPVALWEILHGAYRRSGNYILTPFEANLHITKDDVMSLFNDEHRNKNLFGVKRVPREYNHPIRKLIRELGHY